MKHEEVGRGRLNLLQMPEVVTTDARVRILRLNLELLPRTERFLPAEELAAYT